MSDKIPSKIFNKHSISSDIELIAVESHQNKRKWLSLCVYKPPNQHDSIFEEAISKTINEYLAQYKHVVFFGDFNVSVEYSHLQNLMQIYDSFLLIKGPTCFQFHNPNCVDNFLTNQKAIFKLSRLFGTGLSDHHKLISVVMKSGIFRGPPRKQSYRSYKNFDLEHFNIVLKNELEKLNDSTYNEFETGFCNVLNKQVPIKVKIMRHNNNSFMIKKLRTAIMHTSKFKNRFNKRRTYENWCNYKTQRKHYLSLLRKTKQQYFKNMNLNDIIDNKTFWRTIKPSFNEKGSGSGKKA